MLDDFKSRYMTGGFALSCKYSKPLAAPAAIFILVFQSKGSLSGGRSEKKKKKKKKRTMTVSSKQVCYKFI
ncbi:hypothetical protein HanXRQr2_Chr06g0252401 [Helianthus annuus]|uniref:Uncharacterized protein n=1 Tax=Helianthus annuus TaxID=4232 RepID=A0A9K3IS21_HELAN|nr:hypothetical protein HanXRQr2_Chr06g0252401 [Helianthus annuus]